MSRTATALTILAAVVLSTVVEAAPPPVAVTTCGQVVPPKTVGYLTADLDCTGYTGVPPEVDAFYAGAAVYLYGKASLDLRGFTLAGGLRGVACENPCGRNICARTKCTVFGGTVIGTEGDGIAGDHLDVHDVQVSGFARCIYSYGKSTLSNLVVDSCSATCVQTGNTKISNVHIDACGSFGIQNNTNHTAMRIFDSTISDTGDASIFTDRLPNVQRTTCETSGAPVSVRPSGTWNVCALD